jgi:hypothetical protein
MVRCAGAFPESLGRPDVIRLSAAVAANVALLRRAMADRTMPQHRALPAVRYPGRSSTADAAGARTAAALADVDAAVESLAAVHTSTLSPRHARSRHARSRRVPDRAGRPDRPGRPATEPDIREGVVST